MVKNLPANTGDADLILVGKIPVEREMATHSGILACEIPWTEELVGYSPWSLRSVGHDLVTKQQQFFLKVKLVLFYIFYFFVEILVFAILFIHFWHVCNCYCSIFVVFPLKSVR